MQNNTIQNNTNQNETVQYNTTILLYYLSNYLYRIISTATTIESIKLYSQYQQLKHQRINHHTISRTHESINQTFRTYQKNTNISHHHYLSCRHPLDTMALPPYPLAVAVAVAASSSNEVSLSHSHLAKDRDQDQDQDQDRSHSNPFIE